MNKVIKKSRQYLAKLYTGKELSRLREAVNEFEALKSPTDVDSLLEAVHVWTKRRGVFSHYRVSQGSMLKLMAHFYMNNDLDENNEWGFFEANCWSWLASKAAEMMSSPMKDFELETQFELLNRPGRLDYNGLDKLLEYSVNPQSQAENHRLSGRIWPQETMEHTTFPNSWKLTPLLRNPTTHGIGLFGFQEGQWPFDEGSFDMSEQYVNEPDAPHQNLPPDIGNERLVHYLELPVLSSTVSCYYVSDSWARKQIDMLVCRLDEANERQKKKVMVSPLLRAAILEHVMYF